MNFIYQLLSPFTRLFALPARFFGLPKRLLGLSLPARVALALFLFLILSIIGYSFFIVMTHENGMSNLWNRQDASFSLMVVVLLIGLPTAAYWTTRYWIEVEPSAFPDIDAAWKSGLQALGKAGIDLGSTPLYLAIGMHEANMAGTLMNASGWELLVDGKPDGAAPLRWYASRDAVIVFCLDASGMSLCQAPQRDGVSKSNDPRSVGGASNIRQTLIAGGGGEAERESQRKGIRGTMIADDASAEEARSVPSKPAVGIRGTMIAGSEPIATTAGASDSGASRTIDRVELSHQEERLARVCNLAKESRQPYCTINGAIAFVNWKLLSSNQANSLPMAFCQDALTIVKKGGIHAPLLVVVSGMENEIGFTELVRRVGDERAQGNRFGQGFNHQASPTQQQMIALASNAAGAFEGWVYDLFRQPDCLSRTNNDKLFAMLCRIRSIVQPQLTDLFVGFSESISSEHPRSMFLGGCYFAATGGGKTRQAFVRSVLSKMVEMQEELQWTEKSWREETRYRSLVQLLTLANGLLIVFIIGVIVWRIINPGGSGS